MSTVFNDQARASIELIDKRSAGVEFTPHPALSPMQELQMQIVRTGDLEKLKELRAIEKEWRDDQAKQAFNAAFAAFKGEAVKILRTKLISDGPLKGKKHAELGVIVSAVTPALSQHGLSISWKLTKDDKDWMEVCCTLRHVDGHSEFVTMGGAPDAGPGRNAIQARGSAKTYLERYTATAILGLAPEDEDTDGATPQAPKQSAMAMDGFQLQDYLDAIKGATDPEEARAIHNEAWDKANKLNDRDAIGRLLRAKDARLVELRGKQ